MKVRHAEKLLHLPARDVARIHDLLKAAGLPTFIRLTSVQRSRLCRAMLLDKKVSAGEIKFVLAERIGKVRWGQKVPPAMLASVLGDPPTKQPHARPRN